MAERNTYKELAREWDEKVERGEEMKDLARTDVKVNPNLGVIYSMRFTKDEIATLRQAAASRGVKLSEFVRAVLMEVAQRRHAGGDPVTLNKIREQVRELAETVRQL